MNCQYERPRIRLLQCAGWQHFVIGGAYNSTRIQEFLVTEWRWFERAPCAVERCSHAAAVVRVAATDEDASGEKTLIGVFGGFGGGNHRNSLSSCEVYDVRQDRWFKLPDLRDKRCAPAAACLPGDSWVFVFGGNNGRSQLASMEFCHLGADWKVKATTASTTNFWLPVAPLRTARRARAAAHFRGRLLVAGG